MSLNELRDLRGTEALAASDTIEELLEEYPELTREAILAAIGFGAKALRADVVYPTAGRQLHFFSSVCFFKATRSAAVE
jgi:hypothetical protein